MSDHTFLGIYEALVHDLGDPLGQGRARVSVPAVLGGAVSGWAEPVLGPYVGKSIAVGSRVWVLFEHGDLNRPTWFSHAAAPVTGAAALIGQITEIADTVAPYGWLLCDHAEHPIATYPALYNHLTKNGTVFPHGANTNGSGAAGTTHFRVPDRKGLVGVGYDAVQTEFNTIGKKGGAKTHTLTSAEMPTHTHIQDSHNHTQNSHNHIQDSHNHIQNSHNHTQNPHSHTGSTGSTVSNSHFLDEEAVRTAYYDGESWGLYAGAGGGYHGRVMVHIGTSEAGHAHSIPAETATNNLQTATNQAATATNQATTATNQNAGGGGAHNNLQPYVVTNFIIRAFDTMTPVGEVMVPSRLDDVSVPTVPFSFNGQRLTNLGTPTATTDATTKAYVDGMLADTAPLALGTAAVGTSTQAAREDHVHAMPTLTQVGTPTADRAMGGFKITGLGTPAADTDAVTKAYVDAKSTSGYTTSTTPALVAHTWTASITHSLNVTGVAVSAYEVATGEHMELDWKRVDANNIQLRAGVAMAANSYVLYVTGR